MIIYVNHETCLQGDQVQNQKHKFHKNMSAHELQLAGEKINTHTGIQAEVSAIPFEGAICWLLLFMLGTAFGSLVFSISFLTCSSKMSSSNDLLQQEPQQPAELEPRPLPNGSGQRCQV